MTAPAHRPVVVAGLSAEPLDSAALIAQIRRAECGGLVTFEGSTRSPSGGKVVEYLEYEAYASRAETQIRDLATQAVERWSLCGVVAMHRTGVVPIGEPSVVIGAAAPHRAQAFEAVRWLIDTLKEQVAIWKKEVFESGEAWVGVEEKR